MALSTDDGDLQYTDQQCYSISTHFQHTKIVILSLGIIRLISGIVSLPKQQGNVYISMLNIFESVNSSISEELQEEAKTVFERVREGSRLISFEKLSQMLRGMKIPVPESMASQINRCLGFYPIPKFSFNAFTQFIARATLEQQLQQQIRNLFFVIDRRKRGKVDTEELNQFLQQLTEGEKMGTEGVDELLGELDVLRLGYINYEDLVYLLLPK